MLCTGLPPPLQAVTVASEEFVGVDVEGEMLAEDASLLDIRSYPSEFNASVGCVLSVEEL